MINIFDGEDSKPYRFFKINLCARIHIRNNDGFPQNICDECVLLLDNAYQFKTLCEQSDQILKMEIAQNLQNEIKMELPVHFEDNYSDANQSITDDTNIDTEGIFNELAVDIDHPNESDSGEENNNPVEDWLEDVKLDIITENKSPEDSSDHNQHCQLDVRCHECMECGNKFDKKVSLRRHIKMLHLVSGVCDLCGQSYKNIKLLAQHMKVKHFGEKKFKCKYCPFITITTAAMRKHMTRHTDERRFACDLRNQRFKTSARMDRHVKHNHSERTKYKVSYSQLLNDFSF